MYAQKETETHRETCGAERLWWRKKLFLSGPGRWKSQKCALSTCVWGEREEGWWLGGDGENKKLKKTSFKVNYLNKKGKGWGKIYSQEIGNLIKWTGGEGSSVKKSGGKSGERNCTWVNCREKGEKGNWEEEMTPVETHRSNRSVTNLKGGKNVLMVADDRRRREKKEHEWPGKDEVKKLLLIHRIHPYLTNRET